MRQFLLWLLSGALVVVLLAAGLVFTGYGIYMAVTPRIPAEFAATTEATIQMFESSYQSKAGGRSIRIDYEVNGEQYHESMPLLDDTWQVGDRLQIRYDTRNPANKQWVNTNPMRDVIGGAVICAIGLALLAFVGWIIRRIRVSAPHREH
ncbi:MAG: DUF3592 domain-containing protein [Methylobacillus sp.]|nr:DUF3592 domain-containing protein [Methylobacillus sp.]